MKNTIIINNLDNIISGENTLYQYNDVLINVYRVKNDMYGNPMYHISFYNLNNRNITENYKGKLGRYYKAKGYISFQSYNLSNSISYMIGII